VGVRFIFRPPAEHASGLLQPPWEIPPEEWGADHLIEVAQRGISRHVVRFVESDGMVFALKEIDERLDHSMSYRYVFARGHALRPSDQLIDAVVQLLVRLHLAGPFWGRLLLVQHAVPA
jgi:hypothetical protein